MLNHVNCMNSETEWHVCQICLLSWIHILLLIRATKISYIKAHVSNAPSVIDSSLEPPHPQSSLQYHPSVCFFLPGHNPFPLTRNSRWQYLESRVMLREQLAQCQASFVFSQGPFITGRWPVAVNPPWKPVCSPVCNLDASTMKNELFYTLHTGASAPKKASPTSQQ